VLDPIGASAVDLQDGISNEFQVTQALFAGVQALQRDEHHDETTILAELGETIGGALRMNVAALAKLGAGNAV
jgi:hypothetical protein